MPQGETCTRPVLMVGNCPASSVYGKAKAWTPLLDKPLEGNVYLVGGYGYKLPALVADLNGQIRVTLIGRVDSGKNKGIRNWSRTSAVRAGRRNRSCWRGPGRPHPQVAGPDGRRLVGSATREQMFARGAGVGLIAARLGEGGEDLEQLGLPPSAGYRQLQNSASIMYPS
jgi:hypothetical protein